MIPDFSKVLLKLLPPSPIYSPEDMRLVELLSIISKTFDRSYSYIDSVSRDLMPHNYRYLDRWKKITSSTNPTAHFLNFNRDKKGFFVSNHQSFFEKIIPKITFKKLGPNSIFFSGIKNNKARITCISSCIEPIATFKRDQESIDFIEKNKHAHVFSSYKIEVKNA